MNIEKLHVVVFSDIPWMLVYFTETNADCNWLALLVFQL